jgi:alpha/beta hydrolase family protein
MIRRSIRTVLSFAAIAAFAIGGCGTAQRGPSGTEARSMSPTEAAPSLAPTRPAASPTATSIENGGAKLDVGGFSLWIECKGSGSPTVVLDAGLGSAHGAWVAVAPELEKTTRVCTYDRAGIGDSDSRLGASATSVGAMADELHVLLQTAGVPGPYVLVGHSYGGMIVRVVAHRHPDTVAGLVLVDASSGHQFEGQGLASDNAWYDGGIEVDRITSATELAAVKSLGAIPLVVLTEGQMSGQFEIDWSGFQDELATLSTNALHVVALKSGHTIQAEAPALVIEAVRATVEAARARAHLVPCGERFIAVGAGCIKTTMTAQLEAWDRLRAAVTPSAGSFPAGTYRSELTGAEAQAITGKPSDFSRQVFTWTLADGRWSVSIVTDDGKPEQIGDVYSAIGDVLTLRIPWDYRIPRTSGVNRFRWTSDKLGTVRLEQIDEETLDESFSTPWIPVGTVP